MRTSVEKTESKPSPPRTRKQCENVNKKLSLRRESVNLLEGIYKNPTMSSQYSTNVQKINLELAISLPTRTKAKKKKLLYIRFLEVDYELLEVAHVYRVEGCDKVHF